MERRPATHGLLDHLRGAKPLADWLASPSARQRYESEGVLKVFFAENGTLDDLLTSIRALREDAVAALEHFQRVADRYAAVRGNTPSDSP